MQLLIEICHYYTVIIPSYMRSSVVMRQWNKGEWAVYNGNGWFLWLADIWVFGCVAIHVPWAIYGIPILASSVSYNNPIT